MSPPPGWKVRAKSTSLEASWPLTRREMSCSVGKKGSQSRHPEERVELSIRPLSLDTLNWDHLALSFPFWTQDYRLSVIILPLPRLSCPSSAIGASDVCFQPQLSQDPAFQPSSFKLSGNNSEDPHSLLLREIDQLPGDQLPGATFTESGLTDLSSTSYDWGIQYPPLPHRTEDSCFPVCTSSKQYFTS